MRVFTADELKEILEKHVLWLKFRFADEPQGERADLSSADLSSANLRCANLSSANLSSANLRSANLRCANLSSANLRCADLSSANLRYADLRYANLRYADLRCADLRYADLRYANLSSANLSSIKKDLFEILDSAQNEVIGLLDALKAGRVDGSTYTGDCACLVGTIANIQQKKYCSLSGIKPDSNRPAERWFLVIRKGDNPENNPVSKITVEWVEEYLSLKTEAAKA